MRELKFRVWDDNNKTFAPIIYGEFFLNLNGKVCIAEYSTGNGSNDANSVFEPSNRSFVIQQFTGLKDKESRDIYEGDLLELHHTWETKLPHISPVWIQFDGLAVVNAHPKYTNGMPRALQNFTYGYCAEHGFATCKIIGNIFENPELLA